MIVVCAGHIQRGGAVGRGVGVRADVVQSLHGALAQLLVVIDDQHVPAGQAHVLLLRAGAAQVERDMEFRPTVQLTVHLNRAMHRVHDVLGDRHAQPRALNAVHAGVVLAREGIEDRLLERFGHADAVVLDVEVRADVVRAQRRGLLRDRHMDRAALGRELERVGQQVDQHLVEADRVATHAFLIHVLNEDVKQLALGPRLRLHDAHNALRDLAQRGFLHVEL